MQSFSRKMDVNFVNIMIDEFPSDGKFLNVNAFEAKTC